MGKKKMCVSKDGVGDVKLQQNLEWTCDQGVDCGPIEAGVVFVEPAAVRSRATFAMNSYYQRKGGIIDSACEFSSTAQTTTKDPSYGKCKYV